MDKLRHQRLQAIFEEALSLSGTERDEALKRACGDDAELLREAEALLAAAGQGADLLSEGAIGDLDRLMTAPVEGGHATRQPWAPTSIGGCRVLRLLGAGGMGMVWEAQQEEPHRLVAVKMLGPGFVSESLLRRFRRESEALAMLRHPGVAQIYDVGVDESGGRPTPYIIMELIDGVPLNEYAETHKLSTRARLELAAKVCDAIEHAHQRGVIHRDLKPGNILVEASGQPKVLDFGIARVTEVETMITQETATGQLLGTVAYMSPEQAAGDPSEVDTRSDVYSIGVVLYELLAKRLPHEMDKASLLEIARLIREVDPVHLSRIDTRLRGDVDTIVGKALEKEKARRYQSAGEFAEDIRRYLTDKPISAHPPSVMYQLRKFAKRNRAFVFGVAAVFLTLVGGLIATGSALARESHQRDRAEAALTTAEESLASRTAANRFLRAILLSVAPEDAAGLDTELMRTTLDRAAESVAQELQGHPVIQAEVLALIGEAYGKIGEFDLSVDALQRARAMYAQELSASNPASLRTVHTLGGTLRYAGQYEDAAAVMDEAIEIARRTPEARDELTDLYLERGQIAISMGDFDLTLECAAQAKELIGDERDTSLALQVSMLRGNALRRIGRFDEAEEAYARVISVYESGPEPNVLELADALNSMAIVKKAQGDYAAAEQMYRRALLMRRALDPRPDPGIAVMLQNLGRTLVQLGKLDEAEAVVRESMQMHQELFGDQHFGTAIAFSTLADLLGQQDKYEESLEYFARAMELMTALLGPEHPYIVSIYLNRSIVHLKARQWQLAMDDAHTALAIVDAKSLPASTYRVSAFLRLAEASHGLGRRDAAITYLDEAIGSVDADDARLEELRGKIEEWDARDG